MKKSIEKGREKLRNLTETIKIHYNVLAVVLCGQYSIQLYFRSNPSFQVLQSVHNFHMFYGIMFYKMLLIIDILQIIEGIALFFGADSGGNLQNDIKDFY